MYQCIILNWSAAAASINVMLFCFGCVSLFERRFRSIPLFFYKYNCVLMPSNFSVVVVVATND